ncbi:hypothetical protein [Pseudonocardia oroxyli]|uniref:Uncharacterized protein n=1 Tax=Pseudonocardia oroxyli TaxID=366584 RepID=A0A1G7WZC7_PSEOR|nr:hypothetical protein [Pseudonocardia oroxyli]SDG77289.1 hypothetical protein SAMN05216377_11534 [Pseudonocardia oroxyli]
MRTVLSSIQLVVTEAHLALLRRTGPMDERGGGRNSDEGFHIGAGAVLGGLILTAVGGYVAKKLGALE